MSTEQSHTAPVFLSHAHPDRAFVRDLAAALESLGVPTWRDSRELGAGDALTPEIQAAIENASHLLVVFSTDGINDERVLNEIIQARQQGKKLIPLCFPEVRHALVKRLTGDDLLIIEYHPGQPPGSVLPAIFTALGRQLPDDAIPESIPENPLAELLLRLSDPREQADPDTQARRQVARAELIYYPPDYPERPEHRSRPFQFLAPLGPIEAADLAWYLEDYHRWPVGLFRERGEAIADRLPDWGRALYQAALAADSARAVAQTWRAARGAEKRFSVEVDDAALENAPDPERAAAQTAATALLALPWELLRDAGGWLFQGAEAARVRRRLPQREALAEPAPLDPPIRVLLVSPRPEQEGVGYLDHRVSAAPLTEALAELGDLAELALLDPPTFPALQTKLQTARERGRPFHVVHFDGHGVYDRQRGLGALCFEHPADQSRLEQRRMALVHADDLAATLRDYRVPLMFLEACQSAQSDSEITASVAGRLLQQGVTSVVAMSHSVLVETARRFVAAFYRQLAGGARVGRAMLEGQQALHGDPARGRFPGVGEFRLQDWFVPVLYQERQDPRLFRRLPAQAARRLSERRRRLSLGHTPAPPPHRFVGRSRELLALERLLAQAPHATLRGPGGIGKTALACELVRWQVATGRCQRAAFVNLETVQSPRALLDALGRQLLPQGDNWSVAEGDEAQALQYIQRALADAPALLLLDNCETLLAPPALAEAGPAPFAALAERLTELTAAAPATRLLFTSRETLPPPYAQPEINPGPLSQTDALGLLAQVLAQRGLPLPAPDSPDYDAAEAQLLDLVDSLDGHARALVLLAPELARRGLREVGAEAAGILAELDRQHPGDRENSLYASLELSLRRPPEELRALTDGLGVFHGGANLTVMADVLEVDVDTARRLCLALIEVGLAEDAGYGHLRLDPALPPYLRARAAEAPAAAAARQTRWVEAMQALLDFLHQQIFQDTRLAFQLTLLELPNLLALLRRRAADLAAGDCPPALAVGLANRLETLLAPLARPQALAEAVALRRRAAEALAAAGEAWSQAQYLHASGDIDRLLDQGDLPAAYQAAQSLLQHAQAAGEAAYPEAAYELAKAHSLLGRVLGRGGDAQAALAPLAEARTRFEALAADGDTDAAHMASLCLTETGDCLTALGRLDAAAAAYQEAIARFEKHGDQRSVAVTKLQLGTLRLEQRDYDAALAAYAEARQRFAALGEPSGVATAWHRTGIVYQETRQWDAAERAYREALKLRVQHGLRAGEAASLNELGCLAGDRDRPEEAVNFYRQAAAICTELGDRAGEGVVRSNAAIELLKLRRPAEARRELRRAIECKQAYGHAAALWKTWEILRRLETAEGRPEAAAEAKARAVAAYLAYRRDGGEPQFDGGRLCEAVRQALEQGQAEALLPQLAEWLQDPELPSYLQTLLPKLQAILAGARDPALAADPALDYDDAAELTLLLEQLPAA